MVEIREFDASKDAPLVRAGIIELQDTERSLDQRKPPGDSIADVYVQHLHEQCRKFAGFILIAEIDGQPAGFVCVWTKHRSSDPADGPETQAYVPDLVVLEGFRRRGIGRVLLLAAQDRARAEGAPSICLFVSASNEIAQALYSTEGFRPGALLLEKPL